MYTKLINNNCTGKDKPKLSLQYHSILHFIDTLKGIYNDFVLTTFSITWVKVSGHTYKPQQVIIIGYWF